MTSTLNGGSSWICQAPNFLIAMQLFNNWLRWNSAFRINTSVNSNCAQPAAQNLQVPHPRDWQPVGEGGLGLGTGGIDWCIIHKFGSSIENYADDK